MALKCRPSLGVILGFATVFFFFTSLFLLQHWSKTSHGEASLFKRTGSTSTVKPIPARTFIANNLPTNNPANSTIPNATKSKSKPSSTKTGGYPSSSATDIRPEEDILPKLSALHDAHFNLTPVQSNGLPPTSWAIGSNPRGGLMHVTEAYVYNSKKFARLSGYKLLSPDAFNAHRVYSAPPLSCPPSYTRTRRPWLLQFRNVWMTENGDIFVPIGDGRARTYSFGGGFVEEHWPRYKGRTVRLTRSCRHPVGFALLQNHGYSYFHVMDEQLPRLLSFLPTVRAVLRENSGRIVIPRSPVFDAILRIFRTPRHKWAAARGRIPCFFERVFVPEPVVQGVYPPRVCLQRASYATVRGALGVTLPPPLPRNITARQALVASRGLPIVILIEREKRSPRNRNPIVQFVERAKRLVRVSCRTTRCIANFHELHDKLERELGDKARLVVLSPGSDLLSRSVRAFSTATVVVGAHGAAFANIPHMRGPGTYAVHLGWSGIGFYAPTAHTFGVEHINIKTSGMSQHGAGARADVTVVVSEVRRALVREGFPVNPSIISVPRRRYKHLLIPRPD